MRLDNRAANRKPHSHAARLVVTNGSKMCLATSSPIPALSATANSTRSGRRSVVVSPIYADHPGHRLQRIPHQVDQDLLNFNLIARTYGASGSRRTRTSTPEAVGPISASAVAPSTIADTFSPRVSVSPRIRSCADG